MLIYANYMQIAHHLCKYAKMWFWSVLASFKQAQSGSNIRKVHTPQAGHLKLIFKNLYVAFF